MPGSDSSIFFIVCLLKAESSTTKTFIIRSLLPPYHLEKVLLREAHIGLLRPLIDHVVFEMPKHEGRRDVHQALGVAQKEKPPVRESLVEILYNPLPGVHVKVYEHIPAEYDIHRAHEL